MELTGKQKRYLRGLGAKLKAQVHVGQSGVTENILDEVDNLLVGCELGKVKLVGSKGGDRKPLALELASEVGAELVQILGTSVLLYRENPNNRQIKLPK